MEVTRITFQADEQNLVKTGGLDVFASDTVSYIEAEFSLGTNWTDFDSVRAMWKFGSDVYSTVLDHEGKCIVPWEVLTKRGELKVNLVGSIVENDVLTDRLTTFPVIALIISKIAQVEGENTAEITPSEFEQFVAIVHQDAVDAYDAKLDAETAQNYAETAQGKAEDAQELAESARDSAQGYAEDAEEASQSILGLEAMASVDANVGTPSVNVSVSEVGGNKVMDFDFHNLKGEQGETGATGADGFSPVVAVSEITGGHEVTITDAQGDHSFDVMDGNVENFYSFLPTDSASGSIASFPDGANDVPMSSLVAEIEPIQAGTPTFYGTEQTPYFLKAITNGNTEDLSKIVGGTVVKNQLVQNGNFADGTTEWRTTNATISASDGVLTITPTSTSNPRAYTSIPIVKGHKYLRSVDFYGTEGKGFISWYGALPSPNVTFNGSWQNVSDIIDNTYESTSNWQIQYCTGSNPNMTPYKIRNAQLIDLTLMFGTTIADYLYTLESGSAGAGVAKLREWGYLGGYEPYNTGTLESVSGLTYHKTYDGDGNVLGQTALDSSVTLRGIPKLDSSNNLYYDGDEYLPSGNVSRRYGVVDLGTMDWFLQASYGYMYTTISDMFPFANNVIPNIVTVFAAVPFADRSSYSTPIAVVDGANRQLQIRNSGYTDVTAFKTAMSGVYLIYEKATATTETATPYQGTMPIVAGGSEELIGSPIPVGNSSTYHDVFGISGRTEVKTVREGKNLFDEQSASTTWVNWNGVITTVSTAKTIRRSASAGETYTLSNANASSNTNALMISFFDKTDTIISSRQIVTSGAKFITATAPTNTAYMIAGYFTWSETNEQQLELGSTATTYQPYLTPLTITTELGQTVYGGTLDVVSGVLTVDRTYEVLTQSSTISNWTTPQSPWVGFSLYRSAMKRDRISVLCDELPSYTSGADIASKWNVYGVTDHIYICVAESILADRTIQSFKAWLADNPLTLCYEINEPITIQLTPQEVRTLLGTNNIWSDSGDTEATYKADIQKYIDKQISAVLNA